MISLFLLLSVVAAWALSPAEEAALNTVKKEIQAVGEGRSPQVRALGRLSSFDEHLRALIRKHPELAVPKTVFLAGKPVKILVPFILDEDQVGGFYQISADGSVVLSRPTWSSDLSPLFKAPRKIWEAAPTANDVPEAAELIPIKEGFTAGTPVEPSDIKDCYLIDQIDAIPPKTQEERREYVGGADLKSTLGRRTGSSKCLSYAASMASDWWKIIQGMKLEPYISFVNGEMEYGLNPRLLESLYYAVEKSPYSFIKFTGHDRVTGEEIAYSPKHYAYVLSVIAPPEGVSDPLKKDISYPIPEGRFGMDQPFFVVFNHSKGEVPAIREALRRYGILYAQHTVRLFHDKLSFKVQGMHSVDIVGTGRLNGKDVVLYYETFGKNHRDYLEDSFFGPRLRAFPAGFFYQGIAFPHRIRVNVTRENDGWAVRFTDFRSRPIVPEKVWVKLDGVEKKTRPSSTLRFPAAKGVQRLDLKFDKTYFCVPEENGAYERLYFLGRDRAVEVREYEKVAVAMVEWKRNFIQDLFRKRDSNYDYLLGREDSVRREFVQAVKGSLDDGPMLRQVGTAIQASPILRQSQIAKEFLALTHFRDTQH